MREFTNHSKLSNRAGSKKETMILSLEMEVLQHLVSSLVPFESLEPVETLSAEYTCHSNHQCPNQCFYFRALMISAAMDSDPL